MTVSQLGSVQIAYSRACQQGCEDAYAGVDADAGYAKWSADSFMSALLASMNDSQRVLVRDGYVKAWSKRHALKVQAANMNALRRAQ